MGIVRVAIVGATKKGQRLTADGTEIGGSSRSQLSRQDGRRSYVIGYDEANRRYTCSCPAWIFSRDKRVACKHIRAFLAQDTNLTVREVKGIPVDGRVLPVS